MTQHIAVAESTVSVLGKCGVLRNGLGYLHLAEPPISQVQVDLFAQTPF
jgi:hypothetical protein